MEILLNIVEKFGSSLLKVIDFVDALPFKYSIFVIIGLVFIVGICIAIMDTQSEDDSILFFRPGAKIPATLAGLGIILFPILTVLSERNIISMSLNLGVILTIVSLFLMLASMVLRMIEVGGMGIITTLMYCIMVQALLLIIAFILKMIFKDILIARYIIPSILEIIFLCVFEFKNSLVRYSQY